MPAPQNFLQYCDDNALNFVKRLANGVHIKSVSGDPTLRNDVFKMTDFLEGELQGVGCTVTRKPLGEQIIDGKPSGLYLPDVLFASIGNDSTKKTILIYGHYDVQPAAKEDGWKTDDPFVLDYNAQNPGELIGRGSTDDKGPVIGWINVLEAHKKLNLPLPVNLKFCFEGMEESGSEGLDDLIKNEATSGTFFRNVDAVCITDSYWLNTRTPVLTYGLRGIIYYNLTISGLAFDLHSGAFGGMVHEPLTDLFAIMSNLVAPDGTILIPGVNELVPAPTPDEIKLYEDMDYSMQDFKNSVGDESAGDMSVNAVTQNTVSLLLKRMRFPSLSLHGIIGASSGVESKTVIPAEVTGKFSLRLVQDQTPANVDPLVQDYVCKLHKSLNTGNTYRLTNVGDGLPWLEDYHHWNYEAAEKATIAIYNKKPDYNREGGSIPIALTFSDQIGKNVLLLPMGRGDDGEHSVNEKIDFANYIGGTKLFGAYLYEIADLASK
ncbi:CNDP dipeptidase [Schizopora paradoxa]|uniref:CNDP dipeptidase n=1 Tax=Schizopora paradoxa TaxID=27342 RepID=A0A0H2R0N7_9AGAM|nr:CNDP dipeptidase [Schizopora paradoxa]